MRFAVCFKAQGEQSPGWLESKQQEWGGGREGAARDFVLHLHGWGESRAPEAIAPLAFDLPSLFKLAAL